MHVVGDRHYASKPHEQYVKDGGFHYRNTAYRPRRKEDKRRGIFSGLSRPRQVRKGSPEPQIAYADLSPEDRREFKVQERAERQDVLNDLTTSPEFNAAAKRVGYRGMLTMPELLKDEDMAHVNDGRMWRDVMNLRILGQGILGDEATVKGLHAAIAKRSDLDDTGVGWAEEIRRRGDDHGSRLVGVAAYLSRSEGGTDVRASADRRNTFLHKGDHTWKSPKYHLDHDVYTDSPDDRYYARATDEEGNMITDPRKLKWREVG